jgi:hypothetical protein
LTRARIAVAEVRELGRRVIADEDRVEGWIVGNPVWTIVLQVSQRGDIYHFEYSIFTKNKTVVTTVTAVCGD